MLARTFTSRRGFVTDREREKGRALPASLLGRSPFRPSEAGLLIELIANSVKLVSAVENGGGYQEDGDEEKFGHARSLTFFGLGMSIRVKTEIEVFLTGRKCLES